MQEVFTSTEGLPIKSWASDVEEGALAQASNLARLPFAFKHIALMPDCHQGYGMPIGGVLAAKGVVIPNAVGMDIGCGMYAVKTSLTHLGQEDIKKILGGSEEYKKGIRNAIPVGFNHQSKKQDSGWMPLVPIDQVDFPVVHKNYEKARKQIGTLGGGNHFIEIQKGSDGHIWLMIHSGSRNLGLQVAKHYNALAVAYNEQWFSGIPKKWELAFLPLDTPEGQRYMDEMDYCVKFALANRRLMMWRVKKAIIEVFPHAQFEPAINIAHNYAAMEHHYGENVMIHRKGATRAYAGEFGIIPGSQGTASYIVRGLGNKESFKSCSHGAGRKMGRKQAQRELDFNAEKGRLDRMGVVHALKGKKDLDEAPGAYKDISEVMANQEDLVEVVEELRPLAVVKG